MARAKFPGRYSSLEKICRFVVRSARRAGLDEAARYAVQLATNEASSNIIDHAYGGESNQPIECICVVDEAGITVILRDRGAPFDPKAVVPTDFDVPLKRLAMRGAGMRIINAAMDEVSYGASPDGVNELRMRKRRQSG